MSVSSTLESKLKVVETLEINTGSAAANSRRMIHEEYDEEIALSATSTPPITKCAHFLLTLTAGAATVNLAALTGTNGVSVDGTGLRVQAIRIKNLGANDLTIVPGAANGIDLFGAASSFVVPPSGHVQWFLNDKGPDIAAADRTLDVTGTGTQTSEWSVLMG